MAIPGGRIGQYAVARRPAPHGQDQTLRDPVEDHHEYQWNWEPAHVDEWTRR
jgi:hypothetical protein